MKYLLKFNESINQRKILEQRDRFGHQIESDSDFAARMEKCAIITDEDFEKIENCFLDYFDQDRCYSERQPRLVKIMFGHHEDQTWELKQEIKNDVKRCESYGFKCHVWDFRDFDRYREARILVIEITKIQE